MKKFFVLCITVLTASLYPQTHHLDSLKAVLSDVQGTQRLEVLYAPSNQLEGVLPRDANMYGHEGLALAFQLGDSSSAATLLSSLSYSYSELGDFAEALSYGYRSLEISTAINDKKKIASANSTLGIAYVYLGQYSRALRHHLEALRIREELGLIVPVANTLNNIGIAYHNIGQYDKAIEFYKRALEKQGTTVNDVIRARYCTNIGFSEFKRGNLDSAKMYYTKALNLSFKSQSGVSQAYLFFNFGTLYSEMGDYPAALGYLRSALDKYTSLGQKHGVVQLFNALAQVHYKTKNFKMSLQCLDSAVAIATSINSPDQLKASYETYYRIYQKTGPLAKEYYYYQQFSNAKDSLMNSSESKKIAEALFGREIAEKQRTIELLKKENMIAEMNVDRENFRTYVLFGGVLLAFAVAGFLYRVNLRMTKSNDVIAQKNEELKKLNEDLEQKIGEVNLLSGFLPICSSCKKIRDDDGEWEQMEKYISKRSEATFTHGICPDCMKKLYGNVLKKYES